MIRDVNSADPHSGAGTVGISLIVSGELVGAVSLLSDGVSLKPDHAGALKSLGRALHRIPPQWAAFSKSREV